MAKTVLLLSPLREASGNKSTALRIGSHFTEHPYSCLVKSPKHFPERCDFEEFIEENRVDLVLAIHAAHCAKYLQGCAIPYILIFGGTDINCLDQFCDRFHKITDVVLNAKLAVCFSGSMYDKALKLWPNLPTERLKIIPQGIIDFSTLSACASGVRILSNHDDSMITRLVEDQLKNENHGTLLESTQFFTLVSGIRRVKDPMYILEAFSDWHLNHKDACLIIVGPILDDELGKTFIQKVGKLPGVFYLGSMSLSDTHRIISQSIALLNSSLSEGMSLAILEAMALNVPVVARDIPGNRSLVTHKKTGLIFTTPQECIERCKLIVRNRDLREEIVRSAKCAVESKHSCEAERQAYRNIVQQILSENGQYDLQTN